MAFQQGLSGLSIASKALDAISNNVSNSGTVGYKQASAQFADVFAASLSAGSSTLPAASRLRASASHTCGRVLAAAALSRLRPQACWPRPGPTTSTSARAHSSGSW